MKRKTAFLFLLLCVLALSVLSACRDKKKEQGGDETPPPAGGTFVELNTQSVALQAGETFRLTASVTGAVASIVWSSSDDAVAGVKNGLITAYKDGAAKITASAGNSSAECGVTVSSSVTMGFIRSGPVVYIGGSIRLDAQTFYGMLEVDDSSLQWESSDTATATVADGVVTGKKAGAVQITAVSGAYEGVKATVSVTVRNLVSLGLSQNSVTLYPNEAGASSRAVNTDVTVNGIDQISPAIILKSANDKIATAALSHSGGVTRITVTAAGSGETAIFAEYDGEIEVITVRAYFTLRTPADFEKIKTNLTGWFVMMNDVDFSAYGNWAPVTPWMGDTVPETAYFGGIFDGAGYTIRNISFSMGWHSGIFGQINRFAVVKNVSLVNAVNQVGSNMTGSICAINFGLIENIYAETVIQSPSNAAHNTTGGLIGKNDVTGIIRNCIVKTRAYAVYNYVGCVIGVNYGYAENCYGINLEANLPMIFTDDRVNGSWRDVYLYGSEQALISNETFSSFDTGVWSITGRAIPALRHFSTLINLKPSYNFSTGRTYTISPSNVSGIGMQWNFPTGYENYFDVFKNPDGSVSIKTRAATVSPLAASVSLFNGASANFEINIYGIAIVPSVTQASLDFNHPDLSGAKTISFTDEDGNIIDISQVSYSSVPAGVVTVSNGLITAVGGGAAKITAYYSGNTYSELISVSVRPWVQVADASGFNNMRNNLNANYCLTSNINYGGGVFTTMAPYGGGAMFNGIFDGRGRTVSNLKFETAAGSSLVGIFGYVSANAVVKHCNFADITGPAARSISYGIVGFNYGLIENIRVGITITNGGGPETYWGGGGVAGTNHFDGKVMFCISTVTVSALPSDEYFGGVIGLCQGLAEDCFTVVSGSSSLVSRINANGYENSASITRVAKYASASAAYTAQSGFSRFSNLYWTKATGQLPVIKPA